MIREILAALLMVAIIGGFVCLIGWAVFSTMDAQRRCEDAGYARGEAMIDGSVVCLEGQKLPDIDRRQQ